MKGRKTVRVRALMEGANARMLSYAITAEQRKAIWYHIEGILMDADRYHGYCTVDVTPEGRVTSCGPSSFGVPMVDKVRDDGTTYQTWEDAGYQRWREHAETSDAHRMQFIIHPED